MPANDRRHYQGSYQARAKAVREAAYADPNTRCWRCGLTLMQGQRKWPGRKVTWHAGHVVDGNSSHPLRAEHSVCNTAAGAELTNKKKRLNPSRRWF